MNKNSFSNKYKHIFIRLTQKRVRITAVISSIFILFKYIYICLIFGAYPLEQYRLFLSQDIFIGSFRVLSRTKFNPTFLTFRDLRKKYNFVKGYGSIIEVLVLNR